MSDAYERLKGQYNAVVEERDRYKARYEALVAGKQPQEMMALVCDGRCGHAIVGHNEIDIYAEAQRRAWALTGAGKHYCRDCRTRTE